MPKPCVYILADRPNGVLYVGSSSDLKKRIARHRNESLEGFTKKYHVHCLVYYEYVSTSADALKLEMKLKRWKRKWKIDLIEKKNPDWKDLFDTV
ncbi:MAG: GIY-YIG nuclease family protein [bacterium]|nr:GIY-YIG nuclease family protein [bacterium]